MKTEPEVVRISDDEMKPVLKGKGKAVASESIQITRQLSVKKIVTLTQVPSTWTVPREEEGVAYLLDLSAEKEQWKDEKGGLMTMTSIINGQVSPNFSLPTPLLML